MFRQLDCDFIRINKAQARRLYNYGESVLLTPCNQIPITKKPDLAIWESKDLFGQYDGFDELVEWFETYNCNSQNGRYTAFYIKRS